MDIFDIIKKRRSVRSYKLDPINDETLNKILEVTRLAPTAANRQPLQIIVIKNGETKKKLKPAYTKDWFWEAPVIICACTKPKQAWTRSDGKNYADIDLTITMDHLILAATNEGLGTCWVAAFNPQIIKDELLQEIDVTLEPLALTPLGYPNEAPDARNRKPFDELFRIIE